MNFMVGVCILGLLFVKLGILGSKTVVLCILGSQNFGKLVFWEVKLYLNWELVM